MQIQKVSPQMVNALKEQLTGKHQASMSITPDLAKFDSVAGQIANHGVVANFKYDKRTQVFDITAQHHPFWMTEGHAEHAIEGMLTNLRPASASSSASAAGEGTAKK